MFSYELQWERRNDLQHRAEEWRLVRDAKAARAAERRARRTRTRARAAVRTDAEPNRLAAAHAAAGAGSPQALLIGGEAGVGKTLPAVLARAEGRAEPELWAAAEAAFRTEERPMDLAAIRCHHAETLLAEGADSREAAGRLVAEGRTNRQIAETLFISPKTASVHVSSILAKLSVSTRGEAAALAHRPHLFAAAGRSLSSGPQVTDTRRMRSSPGLGVPRLSVLLVVSRRVWSSRATTVRRRPYVLVRKDCGGAAAVVPFRGMRQRRSPLREAIQMEPAA